MAPCTELLENGVCTVDGCPGDHSLRLCRLCRIWCINDYTFQMHLRGKKHARAVRHGGPPSSALSWCELCKVSLPADQADCDLHVAGRKHQTALATRRLQGDDRVADNVQRPTAPDVPCAVCGFDIYEKDRVSHERSEMHQKKQRFARFRAAFDEAERDKAGVAVEADVDFPFLDAPAEFGKRLTAHRSVEVSFSSTDTGVYLVSARMSSSLSTRGEKQCVQP